LSLAKSKTAASCGDKTLILGFSHGCISSPNVLLACCYLKLTRANSVLLLSFPPHVLRFES
jgi:hypothetical protein